MKLAYIFIGLNLLVSSLLMADVVPHDQDYYTKKVRNTELIYTEKNLPFAEQAARLEEVMQPSYETVFGYVMDETLYVGLISDYNQIANGFSTPFPNNRQINYVGGTQLIDYFCTTSWLDTLLYHETAHNYQMNAKDNVISSSLHSVLGNGGLFFPIFTIPNIAMHPFVLEGNAVVNESWHGNGGRLYSGRFKAQNLLQIRAGYFTPQRMYNKTLFFPYREHYYTMGAFFQYYLAQEHGLKKTNSLFLRNSQDWFWPFFTNNVFEDVFGEDFEESMKNYVSSLEDEASKLVLVEGDVIAHSQQFTSLNNTQEEIFFLTNETLRNAPDRVVFNKKDKSIGFERKSHLSGKLIKHKQNYYTQSGHYINPWRIYQGLYDEDAFILEGSESKLIQGYLRNGQEVYFDVASSYDQAQLYVGNTFYDQVNSSVYIDKEDNLFYFKQKDKLRTLYKNRDPLYSYEGYYGIVSDVDTMGNVYFIASSTLGSTLYCFDGAKVRRASKADNVIEARLVNDTEVLLAATSADDYYYAICDIEYSEEEPYVTKLFFEDKEYYATVQSYDTNSSVKLDLEDDYYSFLNLEYSRTTLLAFGVDSEAGAFYAINANFSDPLTQNSLYLFAQRGLDEVGLAGVTYMNSQYFINYQVQAYGVYDTNGSAAAEQLYRDGGLNAKLSIPLIRSGYYGLEVAGTYFQDYESNTREPISASVRLQRVERFGLSKYNNSLYDAQIYNVVDRADAIYGGRVNFEHELGYEFYTGLHSQYSKADFKISGSNAKGIKVSASQFANVYDPSAIIMPSIKGMAYASEVTKSGASLAKVFNLSSYFFTFPLSVQRESLYVDYNYYDFKRTYANELTLGVELDLLAVNILPIPLKLEYIYNDNELIANKDTVRIIIGASF